MGEITIVEYLLVLPFMQVGGYIKVQRMRFFSTSFVLFLFVFGWKEGSFSVACVYFTHMDDYAKT